MLYLISSLFLLLFSGSPSAGTELRRTDLMAALRGGGYTIILRHARTDRAFAEVRDPVPTKREEQRNLTEEGVRDAILMGVVLKKYSIPIGEIVSSPMYRSIETAQYAAGKPTTVTMALRVFPSTPEQAALVAAAPKPGTNRLLVTHHFVIETHVPGIAPGDIGESEAAVVRTLPDGRVELVGRITIADWQALAGRTASSQAVKTASGLASNGASVAVVSGVEYQNTNGIADPTYPDTPVGRLASGYVTAFNSAMKDRMRDFIESHMVSNPQRTIEDRLESYERLLASMGTLTPVRRLSANDNEVVMEMKAKIGSVRLTVASSAEQGRIQSVTFAMPAGGHH